MTTVLELPSESCMQLMDRHFDITRGIQMANKKGKRDGPFVSIHLALNHDELAQMAGVTKALLSDVLRELEDRGVLA